MSEQEHQRNAKTKPAEPAAAAHEPEEAGATRFSNAGTIPSVAMGSAKWRTASASDRAYENPESASPKQDVGDQTRRWA